MDTEEQVRTYCKRRGLYYLGIANGMEDLPNSRATTYRVSPTPHLSDARRYPTLRSLENIWGKALPYDHYTGERH